MVRSFEKSVDGNGVIMRFKLTNAWKTALSEHSRNLQHSMIYRDPVSLRSDRISERIGCF